MGPEVPSGLLLCSLPPSRLLHARTTGATRPLRDRSPYSAARLIARDDPLQPPSGVAAAHGQPPRLKLTCSGRHPHLSEPASGLLFEQDRPGKGPMSPPPSPDMTIVGNGILGLAAAEALAQVGHRVRVVGPAHRSGGASAAAGAMLGCFGEVTKYTLASTPGRAKLELGMAAHSMWAGFLERLSDTIGSPVLPTATDTYVALNARSGWLDSQNFDGLLAALEEYGVRHDFVESIPGLDPTPDARPLRVLHLPGEGAVDASQVLAALERALRLLGVEFCDATVRNVVCSRGGRLTGLVLDNGESLATSQAVLAAGAATSRVLSDSLPPGSMQPVFSGSGVAYVTQRLAGPPFRSVVRTVNRAGSCGLHVVPLGDGREYFGATNVIFGEPETRPHLGICHFLADCVIDQLNRDLSYARIDGIRFGNRPVPLDTYPLLGNTGIEGLTVMTGTYRDGFHSAPLLAELLVAHVGNTSQAFPTLFDPTRRPLVTMTVEESIDEFVNQMVSSTFESPTRIPEFMHHRDLEGMFRPLAEAMYETLDCGMGLHPDIVNYLVLSRKDPAEVDVVRQYINAAMA